MGDLANVPDPDCDEDSPYSHCPHPLARYPRPSTARRSHSSAPDAPPAVSQTALEHIMTCEPLRVLGRNLRPFSGAAPQPNRLGCRCSSSLADGTGAAVSWAAQLRRPSVAARKSPDLAALGVVHGGEPSRPLRAQGCPLAPPVCSARAADTPLGDACEVRSGPVITGQCGPIPRTNHGQTIKKA